MSHGVRVTLAYDGGGFAGFQFQPGQRTVQGVLADAAERVTRHKVIVRGASRTDAGVHAEGQVAAFASERELSDERWVLALNRYLPDDVSVRAASACAPDYDPRFDALHKTYRYLFHLAVARDALLHGRVFHLGRHVRKHRPSPAGPGLAWLDLDAMRASCARLAGTHDFRAFRSAADARPNTTRSLLRVELIERFCGNSELLALEVQGTAFMLNMVRIIAGTLLDVGRGRLTPDDVAALLGPSGDRQRAGMTAPAHGLTLVAVALGRLRAQASPPVP